MTDLDQTRRRAEAAFGRVAQRMAAVPLCNPALSVELVGLRVWQGRCLGLLITPWTLSLLLLPGEQPIESLGPDRRQTWRFPSGEYAFMGGVEEGLGTFQSCSLFSPPSEFQDQRQARDLALGVLDALFLPQDDGPHHRQVARLMGRSPVPEQLTRRGFLTGAGLLEDDA